MFKKINNNINFILGLVEFSSNFELKIFSMIK